MAFPDNARGPGSVWRRQGVGARPLLVRSGYGPAPSQLGAPERRLEDSNPWLGPSARPSVLGLGRPSASSTAVADAPSGVQPRRSIGGRSEGSIQESICGSMRGSIRGSMRGSTWTLIWGRSWADSSLGQSWFDPAPCVADACPIRGSFEVDEGSSRGHPCAGRRPRQGEAMRLPADEAIGPHPTGLDGLFPVQRTAGRIGTDLQVPGKPVCCRRG